jgi:uncharacterized membrane protein
MRFAPGFLISVSAVLILGCESKAPVAPALEAGEALLAKGGGGSGGGGGGTEFATRYSLPPLPNGPHGEAYAPNQAGTLIVGYSWDKNDLMHPVQWTMQNGAWTISALPFDASATSATAKAVNDQGDKAGKFFPASAPRAVLWHSTGGFTVLGCNELGEGNAISSGAQIVVGISRSTNSVSAMVWRPGMCGEVLPSLGAAGASANAVNGNGTIVGGSAGVPVRWRLVNSAWQVEQLDSRAGIAIGSNSAGDLVGYVQVACASGTCNRGMIWYAAGGSRELPTLGGLSTSPRAINAVGEVVGLSSLSNGNGVPFFWSPTIGMRQLPVTDGAWAFGVSGVRADGTRLVVGAGGRPFSALAWVVKP